MLSLEILSTSKLFDYFVNINIIFSFFLS